MKYLLAVTLLLFSISYGQSQTKSIEEIYEKCYFDAMPNNGMEFKNMAKKYENALMKHELLKDDSAESYHQLFKNIFNIGFRDDITNFHFLDSINAISYVNLIRANKECSDKVKLLSHYEQSRTFHLGKGIDSISRHYKGDIEKQTSFILKFYKKEDFELAYYKSRVLLMVPEDMPLFEEEKSYSKQQIASAFKIELMKGDKLFIGSSEVSLKQMKVLVKEYLKTNRSTSLIQLSSERAVLYSYYIRVVDRINRCLLELRNEISVSKFSMNFEELSALQKESIEKEYSFELIDKVID